MMNAVSCRLQGAKGGMIYASILLNILRHKDVIVFSLWTLKLLSIALWVMIQQAIRNSLTLMTHDTHLPTKRNTASGQ